LEYQVVLYYMFRPSRSHHQVNTFKNVLAIELRANYTM
jgi:hypothetical protein